MSKVSPIGGRLKEERERLGYNQSDFAALAEATRKSQYNYETGDHSPNAEYLAAIAKAGADVGYILTGQRAGALAAEPGEATDRRGYDANPRLKAIVGLLEELNDESLSLVQTAAEREKQVKALKDELAMLKAAG